MFLPSDPVVISTTAGELPSVVLDALDDDVYRVQVEGGDFPVMLLAERAMRRPFAAGSLVWLKTGSPGPLPSSSIRRRTVGAGQCT